MKKADQMVGFLLGYRVRAEQPLNGWTKIVRSTSGSQILIIE